MRKIMPRSEDEADANEHELQQLLDMPDPILRQKLDLQKTYKTLERLDTGISDMESLFYRSIDERGIALDQSKQSDKYQDMFEMQELKNLELEIQKVEEEKIELLRKEKYSEAELMEQSGHIGLSIDDLEKQNEFKAKERERALTQLFARMNNKFKH